VSGPEALAVRVGKKLRNEESLIVEYSGIRLRMDLDRIPLWRGNNVTLKELWSDYSQYLYLPRLLNSGVLLDAVRSGVASTSWDIDAFAYAGAVAEDGRYSGLVGGKHPDVVLDSAAVVVHPDVAVRQLAEPPPGGGGGGSKGPGGPTYPPGGGGGSGGGGPQPPVNVLPTRFFGHVSLEPVRMLRDLGDIAEAIVAQLGRANPSITISVEIEATTDEGFPDDVRRTVSENARTLKFDAHEFED
jgi:hypothetical protein